METYMQAWKRRNAEHVRAYAKRYRNLPHRKLNQRAINLCAHYRKKFGTVGKFTGSDIARKMQAQRGRCVYCHADIREVFEIDHIIPASKGGANWPENIQLLCVTCNQKKADRILPPLICP